MEFSNLVWHLGAVLFALWASFTALAQRRKLEACEKILLPACFAPWENLNPNQLRSLSARVASHFESELKRALQIPVEIRFPAQAHFDSRDLSDAVGTLWVIRRNAEGATLHIKSQLAVAPITFQGQVLDVTSLITFIRSLSPKERIVFTCENPLGKSGTTTEAKRAGWSMAVESA